MQLVAKFGLLCIFMTIILNVDKVGCKECPQIVKMSSETAPIAECSTTFPQYKPPPPPPPACKPPNVPSVNQLHSQTYNIGLPCDRGSIHIELKREVNQMDFVWYIQAGNPPVDLLRYTEKKGQTSFTLTSGKGENPVSGRVTDMFYNVDPMNIVVEYQSDNFKISGELTSVQYKYHVHVQNDKTRFLSVYGAASFMEVKVSTPPK